ncbi:MAG: hypothetical protein HQ464_02660 [Planctomycetes bacterium]|nr:hypothetical protein [Planctomycetota bacterium]
MAIVLGKDGAAPPIASNVITATFTEEAEAVDISNRDNIGGTPTHPGHRIQAAGLTNRTWEVECHDPADLITDIEANAVSGYHVMNISENVTLDGAVTYTVTLKEA